MSGAFRREERSGPMERLSFYRYIPWLIKQFFDVRGCLLEADQVEVASMKRLRSNAPEQFELLRQVLDYALHADYFTWAVKGYLLERDYYTQMGYAEKIGMKDTTFRAQLDRSRKRFIKEFGEDCIEELADLHNTQHYNNAWLCKERLNRYRDLLLSKKFTVKDLQNCMYMDIKAYMKQDNFYGTMDRDVFKGILEELHHHTKEEYYSLLADLEETEFFGYVNHLMKTVYKDDKEREDFDLLLSTLFFLSGKDNLTLKGGTGNESKNKDDSILISNNGFIGDERLLEETECSR